MASGNIPAPLGEKKTYTATLEPGFSLASWGSIVAESIGNILIITGVGVKSSSQVVSGKLCTFSGLSNAHYSTTTGFVEGSSNNTFMVLMSYSGDGNSITVENVKNANANMYFQLVTIIR